MFFDSEFQGIAGKVTGEMYYYALNNEHMYATQVPLLQVNSPGFLFGSAITHIFPPQ